MSKSLRIAMFTGAFPVLSETHVLRQINGLIEGGHEVDIYADSREDVDGPVHPELGKHRLMSRTVFTEIPPETVRDELPVWPLTGRAWIPGTGRSIHNMVRLVQAFPQFLTCLAAAPGLMGRVLRRSDYGHQAASLSALYRLARLAPLSRSYHVLHAHGGAAANNFRFARTLWKVPLVASFHGFDFFGLPRQDANQAARKVFATAEVVTADSEYGKALLLQMGCPPDKLRKLPRGLALEDFVFRERVRRAGEPLRILTIARMVEAKGIDYALQAVAALRKHHPLLRYDLLGDGPLRARHEALARELGIQECTIFHGARAAGEVKRLLGEAHLFLLTSVAVDGEQEGQGLVLQEAQAVGLPVVATNQPAFREGVVEEQSACLVPERDAAALVERLNFLAVHPEIWPTMGRTGRALVEQHYDIKKLNAALVQIYREAAGRFHQSRTTRSTSSAS